MASLNLDFDYFDHPKTKRLVGLLGRGSEVLPLKLWCYCGKFHPRDGRLTGYAIQEIESLVGWWGKSGRFVDAMLTVGFLHQEENGYVVHEWKDHEGHLISYIVRAKKAAKARWDRVNGECFKHATSNARDGPKQSSCSTKTLPLSPREKVIEETRKKLKGANGHATG